MVVALCRVGQVVRVVRTRLAGHLGSALGRLGPDQLPARPQTVLAGVRDDDLVPEKGAGLTDDDLGGHHRGRAGDVVAGHDLTGARQDCRLRQAKVHGLGRGEGVHGDGNGGARIPVDGGNRV